VQEEDQSTRVIRPNPQDEASQEALQSLREIYQALQEKGYDPIRQIASFLFTGEPTYITAHRGARALASKLERDEVLQELVRFYLRGHCARTSE